MPRQPKPKSAAGSSRLTERLNQRASSSKPEQRHSDLRVHRAHGSSTAVAWLIEHKDGKRYLNEDYGRLLWGPLLGAIRFSRKVDAERAMAAFRYTGALSSDQEQTGVATQHVWTD